MDDISFQPDWFSKPGDTLLSLMEQRELTSERLAHKLGCSNAVVHGLLTGTIAVDSQLAVGLAKHVGGTPKFWQARQETYEHSLSRVAKAVRKQSGEDWVKLFPHAAIAKNGWIKRERTKEELLKAYLAYFGVNGPGEWKERYVNSLKSTAFRTSAKFESKIGPLSAWLRQGEIEAAQVQCRQWNPKGLGEKLSDIRVLSKAKNPEYFLPRLRKVCSEFGVAVVFVRAPVGCSASGATRFLSKDKAMIILSFRYLSDDHFWFTFFHEVGHLLLHSSSLTFIDGEGSDSNDKEKEANDFAERILVPLDRREELSDLRATREAIVRFAYSVGIAPGIVVGQMQHYNLIKRNQMNYLKRKFDWRQIEGIRC